MYGVVLYMLRNIMPGNFLEFSKHFPFSGQCSISIAPKNILKKLIFFCMIGLPHIVNLVAKRSKSNEHEISKTIFECLKYIHLVPTKDQHCVKSVRIQSCSGPYLLAFGLNNAGKCVPE